MTFINLTPHTINIHTPNGVVDIAPSGDVARVATVNTDAGDINGIPVGRQSYGDVDGLPKPVDGVIYIVSGLVRAAVSDRKDVASPGALVRDDAGRPIGCDGLIVN